MSQRFASDYIDVATRIADFRAQYPDGSLQPVNPEKPFEIVKLTGADRDGNSTVEQTFIVYTAAAYRSPDDQRPGIGTAYEVFPGRTPYTRGSELMNAETSAWGRAIVAALAADSRKGIASAEEVRNRSAEREDPRTSRPTNKDGSTSRSRATDEQLAANGEMTKAQRKEHNALERDTLKNPKLAERATGPADDDPWATGGEPS